MVQAGEFREDLYYRLNVYPITVLPLRMRRADIIPLAKYFVERYNLEFGLQKSLGAKALVISGEPVLSREYPRVAKSDPAVDDYDK